MGHLGLSLHFVTRDVLSANEKKKNVGWSRSFTKTSQGAG
jgi:hypothetical protein